MFTVIVVSLLVGIICTSLIMVAYYQRIQVQLNERIKRLHSNAYSGINLMLANQESVEEGEIDLYGEEHDSVRLKKKNWGIFEVLSATAFSQNSHVQKTILCGYKPDKFAESAIYLADQNHPLSLSGNTVIIGDCYLPEAGVKRAYIEGSAFSGKDLIRGQIRRSTFTLPKLEEQKTRWLLRIMEEGAEAIENGEVSDMEQDTIIQSFQERPLLITLTNRNGLKGKVLEGNIIIFSSGVLEVDSSSKLKDVILVSPAIVFKDYFEGSLQAFGSDSIVTGENCRFAYPSVLGMIKKDFKTMQPFIRIGKKTQVKGVLFSFRDVQDLQQTRISLEEESQLEGQVYADGFLEIKGTVYGNVLCNKFTLKTPSSVYENHLINAMINVKKRSPWYIGSSLLLSTQEKRIVKWLY